MRWRSFAKQSTGGPMHFSALFTGLLERAQILTVAARARRESDE